MNAQKGFSLLEVLVAISMLALLLAGGFSVLRIVLKSSQKIENSIAAQNRVTRAETALREEIASMLPVSAQCSSSTRDPMATIPFFEGEPDEMRLISQYSLEERFRAAPQFTELKVTPSPVAGEFRLIANQSAWQGASFIAPCLLSTDSAGVQTIRFAPVESSASSFVLADKLIRCEFSYLRRGSHQKPIWIHRLPAGEGFPDAVRIDLKPEPHNRELIPLESFIVPIRTGGD